MNSFEYAQRNKNMEIAKELVAAYLKAHGQGIPPNEAGEKIGEIYKAVIKVVNEVLKPEDARDLSPPKM
jgi:hypothetical protein